MASPYENTSHKDIPGNPSTAKSSHLSLNKRKNKEHLRVLSEEQWSCWIHKGYVVIPQAIPAKQVQECVEFIWEFEEKDPEDPSTWYRAPSREMRMKELQGSGMVEAYNHPSLWNNRQHPRVYEAFVDVWGTEKLWVSIDRANLNLPNREGHQFKGFIHWDYDPETKPVNVQGVIALSDQRDEAVGGFQCVPELYRNYDRWKKSQPKDRNPFQPDVSGLEIEKVAMKAGDLLIFNSLLAHGIRPNTSKQVRIAQYITMMPAEEENEALRAWRIRSWRDRVAPEGYAFPGDPRNWEQKKYPRAELSDLGKKLLGLENW